MRVMLSVTGRIALASVGAYALAVSVAALSARALPATPIEAALAGTIVALPTMVAAAIAAFGLSKLRVAALWIVGPTLLFGMLAWWISR